MKELYDRIRLEVSENGSLVISVRDEKYRPKSGFIWLTDATIEKLPGNRIKVSGREIITDGGYEKHKKLVKHLLLRPLSEYIKVDKFGREYVKYFYSYPPFPSKTISIWESDKYKIEDYGE